MAEAIASSIRLMTGLRTPIVTVITGEGGSGGALAIAVGDVVLALENAIYSVISPKGCAASCGGRRRGARRPRAMRLTADEQQALGVIDLVMPEPGGGAHADPRRDREAPEARSSSRSSTALAAIALDDFVEARYQRYRAMGDVW